MCVCVCVCVCFSYFYTLITGIEHIKRDRNSYLHRRFLNQKEQVHLFSCFFVVVVVAIAVVRLLILFCFILLNHDLFLLYINLYIYTHIHSLTHEHTHARAHTSTHTETKLLSCWTCYVFAIDKIQYIEGDLYLNDHCWLAGLHCVFIVDFMWPSVSFSHPLIFKQGWQGVKEQNHSCLICILSRRELRNKTHSCLIHSVQTKEQNHSCLIHSAQKGVKEQNHSCLIYSVIVQELCESRGGRPGLSVLTSLLVSVDVKNYWTVLRHWSQLVPNVSTDMWGHSSSSTLSRLTTAAAWSGTPRWRTWWRSWKSWPESTNVASLR